MKRPPRARLLIAAALAGGLCAAPAPARAQLWKAGEIFEAGVGGRALGMGGAQVAESGEATALYYNPAGLALLTAPQVEMMHAALFEGASFDHIAYAQGIGERPMSWGAQVLRLNSGAVAGTDALNNPTGSYQYNELAVSGGFAERGAFLPLLSLGAAGKILRRTIPGSSDQFLGADLGAQYGPILGEQVTLGAVMRNVLSVASGDTSDSLPVDARLGASWRPIKPVTLTGEIDQSKALRLGAEYSFGAGALRVGYNPDGITFGGGITFRQSFSFDLAMINSTALGISERVSLTYRFGSSKKPRRLNALADMYLQNGRAELAQRDYVAASRDIDIALGMDSKLDDGQWKHRARRLHELVAGMELAASEQDQKTLRDPGPAGDLPYRAIQNLIEGEEGKAMLIAHVAAGSAGPNSVQSRLLRTMAKITGQAIMREDLLGSAVFVSERGRRSINEFRAGHYDASARAAEEALLIAPDDVESLTRLGSAQFAAGRKDQALAAYRRALELDPGNARLRTFVKDKFGE